jgi:hypothetical protein
VELTWSLAESTANWEVSRKSFIAWSTLNFLCHGGRPRAIRLRRVLEKTVDQCDPVHPEKNQPMLGRLNTVGAALIQHVRFRADPLLAGFVVPASVGWP